MRIFNLPDLGEGLHEAEIVAWYVAPGDTVDSDQLLVAMESAKAIVDIPSPQHGVIKKLFGDAGDIVRTGEPLVEFMPEKSDADELDPGSTGGRPLAEPVASRTSTTVVGELQQNAEPLQEAAAADRPAQLRVKATPAVRALARKYSIDLAVVTPTGPEHTVTREDVERVAKIFAEVGPLKPLRGARRSMALTMAQAHAEVVPVTLHDDADISQWPAQTDVTTALVSALVSACRTEPALNSWYDSHAVGRRLLDAIHIGLAVDTAQGLFVPVLRDAQNLRSDDTRSCIETLVGLVENRKIRAADLRGATISLSNFGSIGGKYASPVVVPPTVAIVGVGRAYPRLLQHTGANGETCVQQHLLLPLSLTIDHRAVTGAEASHFMNALRAALEQEKA